MSRFAALVFFPLIVASAAQSPDGVIHVSTRLVQINVVVHGKREPVVGLTRNDFTLTDRGKPQTIAFFSVESLTAPAGKQNSLPVNTFSNRRDGATGITAILLDGLNTRFEDQTRARRQFEKLLRSIRPTDRIAIYTLGRSLRVLCDFTGDPEQLHQFLATYHNTVNTEVATAEPEHVDNGDPFLDPFLNEVNRQFANSANFDRARLTTGAFLAIANHFAALPGRKNLIWLTGSFPFSLAGVSKSLNNADIALYPVDARGLVDMPEELTAVAAGARNDRKPPRVPSFSPMGLTTLQELADLTGGRAFYNTNDITGALRAALDDSSTSFTLGFYPDPASLDGKFHPIRVEVQRAGLSVRARNGYFASPDTAAPAPLIQDNIQLVLRSPLEASGIPLSARIARTNRGLKVWCSVDIRRLHLQQTGDLRTGAINLFLVQQDETGKQLDFLQEPIEISLTKSLYETYLNSGMVFIETIQPKKALSTLRLLVADRGNARVASVIIPIASVH